jgi:hypothetical protein
MRDEVDVDIYEGLSKKRKYDITRLLNDGSFHKISSEESLMQSKKIVASRQCNGHSQSPENEAIIAFDS